MYQTVREYIGDTKDKVVFDLYSGTGTIAQIAAAVAKQVIGVEIIPEAVEAAKENAAMNGITNCTFLADDVLKALDYITEKPDLIILDPPRDGVHPKALPKILDYGVERIVYISCKPSSLARDLAMFGLLLANDGVQLSTGKRLISSQTVRMVQTIMLTCGMYDGSGEFALRTGIPTKSGVGGGLLSVSKKKMGIGIYGPSLDKKGNCIAGCELLGYISEALHLHIFDTREWKVEE